MQAFKKVERPQATDESKKGFIWILEPAAILDGVKSTTRYRKLSSNKKSIKAECLIPQRQRSGAKGGKAARKAAKVRRYTRLDGPRTFHFHDTPPDHTSLASEIPSCDQKPIDNATFPFSTMPYYLSSPPNILTPPDTLTPFTSPTEDSPVSSMIAGNVSYGFASIAGCAPRAPRDPLFYSGFE